MKKIYVAPQTEEMMIEPIGCIMETSIGAGGLPDPHPMPHHGSAIP